MAEGYYELNNKMFEMLKTDNKLLNSFGYRVAINSAFKPSEYGYYGCRLYEDKNEHKYYLVWKHNEKRLQK